MDNSKAYIGMSRRAKADTIFPIKKTNGSGYEHIIYPCSASALTEYHNFFPREVTLKKVTPEGEEQIMQYAQINSDKESNKLLECILSLYPMEIQHGETAIQTAIRILKEKKDLTIAT